MKAKLSRDGWRWELYRNVALFVHNPNDHTEDRLKALMDEFRAHIARQCAAAADEHEYVADYL